ncbi:MAG: rod shape-determining protein MreC [Bdellovibrionales bacterium]|nr:rod shape-determining protein MreC [Bdellovibrionales bacterium]
MWSIIKEYRHYVVTLVLALIPIIALNTGGKQPADLHWYDRAVLAVSAPVQGAIRGVIDYTWDLLEDYLFVLDASEDNADLAHENRRLLNEIAGYQEMVKENERLRKTVEFGATVEGRKIVARVIAQDVSTEFRMIRINKGTRHGVTTGMSAVALEGVVGRVFRAGDDYADVLTLLDSSSAVDSIVQRTRVRGIAEGLGESNLALKYLRRTDDVQEGDVVVSSGIGGIFPKGLLVGRVASVKKKSYGISQEVELVPSVEFSRLEEVTVVEPPKMPAPPPAPSAPKSADKKGADKRVKPQ